jgi:hypothetical protein
MPMRRPRCDKRARAPTRLDKPVTDQPVKRLLHGNAAHRESIDQLRAIGQALAGREFALDDPLPEFELELLRLGSRTLGPDVIIRNSWHLDPSPVNL